MKLTDVLEKIAEDTSGEKTTINDVVKALQSRGLGPLLIAPSAIAIFPTSAIPGVPTLCALTILMVSLQLAFGKTQPWLPKTLRELQLSREKLRKGVDVSTKYTKKIDKLFKPRWQWMTNPITLRLCALLAGCTALLMIPLEMVPFAAMLPAIAVALIGVALSTEDGLLLNRYRHH